MIRNFYYFALAGLLFASAATAQSVQVDPAVVTRESQESPAIPQPSLSPKTKTARPDIDAAAEKKTFTLRALTIEGMTVYAPDVFTPLYADKIGTRVSVGDITRIAQNITKYYHNHGYILARAYLKKPPARGADSITILVAEGHIAHARFEGDVPDSGFRRLVNRYVEKLKAAKPLSADTLERYLLLINDIPGSNARAVLRATKTPGESELIIGIHRKPVDVFFSTDNRGSRFIGRWQEQIMLNVNDALGMAERTSVRFITASPTKELRYIDLFQEYKLNAEGTTVRFGGAHVETIPGEDIDDTQQLRGQSTSLSVMLTHPFIRAREQNFYGRVGIDLRDSVNDQNVNITQNADRIRSLRLGGTYNVVDTWEGINTLDLQLSQGIDGLGATDAHGLLRSRVAGEQDYTKLTANASHTQPLPKNFSLFVATSGQYSRDPLLISEQFFVGGAGYGRGYDPAELSGDHGISGKIELRYSERMEEHYLQSYQFYGFYDVGKVWRKAPLASEKSSESLTSAGAGVNLTVTPYITGNLEVAFPLTKDVTNNADQRERILGGLTIRY
jgi:hemolysin activation/secretion protein